MSCLRTFLGYVISFCLFCLPVQHSIFSVSWHLFASNIIYLKVCVFDINFIRLFDSLVTSSYDLFGCFEDIWAVVVCIDCWTCFYWRTNQVFRTTDNRKKKQMHFIGKNQEHIEKIEWFRILREQTSILNRYNPVKNTTDATLGTVKLNTGQLKKLQANCKPNAAGVTHKVVILMK